MSGWRDFTLNPRKKNGWIDCTRCRGVGANANRTRVCACCRGEGGYYTTQIKGDYVVPIPADAEVFSVEPISKVDSRNKGEKKYAASKFNFKLKSGF